MTIALTVGVIIIIGAMLWGPMVSNVEQAKYKVISAEKNDIEIRDYAPMIIAETTVVGEREIAINEGFRLLADYIFGNNTSKDKLAMTAPVIQKTNEKISMTAPVTQQGNNNEWVVRFVMPSQYTMDTLPKPNNDRIKLSEMAGVRYAVIRFAGLGTRKNLSEHEADLKAFIDKKGLQGISAPTYAFFNPPWTIPFLRRNEIMVEIKN